MPELGAIHDDVRFAWSAAEHLAAQLRATATVCEEQISHRNQIAGQASQEWRGTYAEEFAVRIRTCISDAQRLAAAMRQAADQVDELRRLAREEQTRRERAREWEREKNTDSVLETIKEFFTGEDDKPPIPGPVEPPRYTSQVAAPGSRG
jgi:hypothetical protein